MRISQLIIFLIFLSLSSYAQQDSLVIDKNLDIDDVDYANNNDSELVEKSGIKFINKPLLPAHFEYVNGFYTRNYGGYFSEISLRGGSPQQTSIAWYGVPISNEIFDTDASLISLDNTSDFYFIRSGASAKFMNSLSGIVNIFMDTDLEENDIVNTELFYGNYGVKELTGKMKFGSRYHKLRFSYSRMISDNNFSFNDKNETTTNSKVFQGNLHLDYNANLRKDLKLGIHYWSGSARKEKPTNRKESESEAYKENKFNRFIVDASKTSKHFRIDGTTTVFADSLRNYENLRAPAQRNIDISFVNKLRFTYLKNKKDKAYLGVEHRTVRGISQWFDGRKRSDVIDGVAGYHLRSKIINLQAATRVGIHDQGTPVALSLEFTKLVNNSILLHSKISKDYRNPRLIELYCATAGNSNLKRETSFSQEITLNHFSPITYGYIVGFNKMIDNWIMYSTEPNDPNGHKSFRNIGKVHNYGLETFLRLTYPITEQWAFVLFGSFALNHVKAKSTLALPDIQKGEQLPLSPKYIGDLQIGLLSQRISTGFSQRWFSKSRGLYEEIPRAVFTDFRFQANLSKDLSGVLSINNIFDKETYSTDFNPQKGRHLEVRFIFQFHP